jgi:hypothetical protein
MAETIKVNFALQADTVEKLEELCKLTYRGKSDLVDYLVAKEYRTLANPLQASETQPAVEQK